MLETLLKRHFWIINLCGLGVIAWLLAGSITGVLGMQLAARAGAGISLDGLKASDGDSRLARRLATARASDSAAGRMDGASAFLIDEPPSEDELPQEEAPEEEEPDEPGELEASYEATSLPIRLLGTMVVIPARYSSATVELERRDQKIVTRGFELLSGQAKVHAIRRTYLILEESGKLTIARLWPTDKDKKASPHLTAASPSPVRPSISRPRVGTRRVAEGVRRISGTTFQVDRGVINRKLKNLAALGQQVRVVPNYHRGRYSGFRMIGMRNGSLFSDIGFQNGDIIKVINGSRIDSPNKALSLYEALKSKSRLTVQVERGGMLKTMRYLIR